MFAFYSSPYSGVPSYYYTDRYALAVAEHRARVREQECRRAAEVHRREQLRKAMLHDYASSMHLRQQSYACHDDEDVYCARRYHRSRSMGRDSLKAQRHAEQPPELEAPKTRPRIRIPVESSPPQGQVSPVPIAATSPSAAIEIRAAETSDVESVPVSSRVFRVSSQPSPTKQQMESAARKIQSVWRSGAASRATLSKVTGLSAQFENLRESFSLPDDLDFSRSPASSSSPRPFPHPPLLYTKNNIPIHAHEEALTRLLTQIDFIESNGDRRVRHARRDFARGIEKYAEALELQLSLKWDELSHSEAENENAVDESEMTDADAEGEEVEPDLEREAAHNYDDVLDPTHVPTEKSSDAEIEAVVSSNEERGPSSASQYNDVIFSPIDSQIPSRVIEFSRRSEDVVPIEDTSDLVLVDPGQGSPSSASIPLPKRLNEEVKMDVEVGTEIQDDWVDVQQE